MVKLSKSINGITDKIIVCDLQYLSVLNLFKLNLIRCVLKKKK